MRVLIATDAWEPQTNGIVTTLRNVKRVAKDDFGVDIVFLTPKDFKTFKYKGIDFALPFNTAKKISPFDFWKCPNYFDHIHIATEGPIGWAVRRYCIKNKIKFTTSYHTKFPEYLKKWFGIPTSLSYPVLRHFHNKASSVMVCSSTMFNELSRKGFNNLDIWHRGVDHNLFHIRPKWFTNGAKWLFVGRVSKEKNLPAFFELDLPGEKWVVGDGPMLTTYRERYPNVHFYGSLHGEVLADRYSQADVFVFPSKTDTFGHVMIEAMACGLPVAAYPVTGPLDVLTYDVGYMDENLQTACLKALAIAKKEGSKERIREYSKRFDWHNSVEEFLTLIKRK